MVPKSKIKAALAILTIVFVGVVSEAETKTRPKADNSAINKRDLKANQVTAETQGQATKEDVELTRLIRQKLMEDKDLSVYAHNVKIVTINGISTLKGPVHTLEEKNKVAACAKQVVPSSRISNELEVVGN